MASRWTATEIIAELVGRTDQCGTYIADGDYEWSRQAILYLRDAWDRGETMCAFAAQWCDPDNRRYREFNRRWERFGRPVHKPEST